jgi:hypothetical protein
MQASIILVFIQRNYKWLDSGEFYLLGHNGVYPLKVNWRFGGTCRLQLQVWRFSRARNQLEIRWKEEICLLPAFTVVSCSAYSSTLKTDRGFEFHPRYGCLCVFLCLCCPVYVAALRQGWSPVQGVLRPVWKIHSFVINSEREQARGPNPSRYKKKKSEEERHLGRRRCEWQNNINLDVKEMGLWMWNGVI